MDDWTNKLPLEQAQSWFHNAASMDIFKKFESSLLEYEYDYNYGDSAGSQVQEDEVLQDESLLKVTFLT